MLPATARLRQRAEFTATVRRGRRGRSGLLAVHFDPSPASARPEGSARVGFVVSRAVGPAVVRNRVLRRLRHLTAARLDHLPDGSSLVVRAFPAAGAASSAGLGEALDRALVQALSQTVHRPRTSSATKEGQVTGR